MDFPTGFDIWVFSSVLLDRYLCRIWYLCLQGTYRQNHIGYKMIWLRDQVAGFNANCLVLVFISFRCWTRQSSNDLIPLWLYNLHSFCGSSAQKVLRDNSATSRLFFSSSIYPGRGLPTYHLPLCYCLCMKTLPFNWHLFRWREQPHRFCDFIRKVSTSPSLHFANRSATEICRRLYIHILSEGSPCGKRSIWFMCVRYWGPF